MLKSGGSVTTIFARLARHRWSVLFRDVAVTGIFARLARHRWSVLFRDVAVTGMLGRRTVVGVGGGIATIMGYVLG